MMCVGENFAIICLKSLQNKYERKIVYDSLINSNKEIIEISFNQLNSFAGNMLQLKTIDLKNILVMSSSAYNSLNTIQIFKINKYCKIVNIPIKTIETIGGGSVRCMIAEIFLPQKNN